MTAVSDLQGRAHVGQRAARGALRPLVVGRRRPDPARPGPGVAAEVRRRPRVGVPCEALGALPPDPVGELLAAAEIPRSRLRPRYRKALERLLERGDRGSRRAARAVVEQDAHRRLGLEGGERRLVVRLLLDRIVRQADALHPQESRIEHGSGGPHGRWQLGSSPGDVELEEVEPAVERRRVERVRVDPVCEREPLPLRAGEARGQRRAVAARLLVGPLAGEEHRDVDLVDEGDRRQRVDHLRAVVVVAPDLRDQVDRLRVEVLVRPAGLVASLDPAPRPWLTRGRAGGLRRRSTRSSAHERAKPVLRIPPG